jgi:hypothetical protein
VATQPNTQNQKRLQLAVELRGCCRKVQGRRQFKWKARRTYYIRALVKEGGGGEYLDVGMRTGRKEWFPIPLSAFAKPGNHIALPGPPGMPAGLTQGTALKCGAPVCEYRYNNIPGASIQSLTSSPQYPMSPSKMIPVRRGTFSMSTKGDNFGVMMEGFYLAPVTGTYTFSTRSDDASVVYVATQPNTQQGLIKVVELTGCCRKVMGTRKVLWQQGGKYYIRAAVKEQQGGEYLYVGTTVTTGPPPAKLLSSQCQDGDVRVAPGTTIGEGTDMYPEVSYKGKWYPICGHYFWDNDDGATSFCKRLGFRSGIRGKRGGTFNIDAMPVGKCRAGQRLNQCNAGGHAWGNFNYNNGWCKKGKNIALAIKCIGGKIQSCGAQAQLATKCANEHQSCKCNGMVAYGHHDHKGNPVWSKWKSVRGSIGCTNAVFGDPGVGTFKYCVCHTGSVSACKDGDVRVAAGTTIGEGKDMYPEVNYRGKWYPICGHYFWDNNDGATSFCKRLGFTKGTRGKRGGKFNIDAMPVGKCKAGQRLNQCNAGGHAWGNFNYNNGWCKKGKNIALAIKCIGGTSTSCGTQAPASASTCTDGDVRVSPGTTIGAGKDMYPEVSYMGRWYPICGHYFWDNNHGATMFCKQLGFRSGVLGKRGANFNIDAMPVGKCRPGQHFNQCNAGGHAWGNFNYRGGWCKKGRQYGGRGVGVAIKCIGGKIQSCGAQAQLATKCANEHQSCKCNGMVAYGHHDHRGNPVWSKWKSVRGSIGCTNAVFGDPGVGTVKYCVCHTGSVSACKDGDVRVAAGTTIGEGTDMYPEVSYKGKWYPICGHYFWDNNDGATSFCKQLGFSSGVRGKRGGTFNIDAMPVGKCKAGQRLNQCNAGGHAWGNFNYNNGWCKKGKNIAVAIKCVGGMTSSCNKLSQLKPVVTEYFPIPITQFRLGEGALTGGPASAPGMTTGIALRCGAAVCEYQYTGIGGTKVPDLLRSPKFPRHPSKIIKLTHGTFSMTMKGNNLGVMMEGFVRAPVTGAYSFSTRSDDSSAVWAAQQPNTQLGLTKVVELNGCCRKVQGKVKLQWVAGQAYYIRAYVKEGGGGEYGQIGMRMGNQEWFPIPITAFVKLGSQTAAKGPSIGVRLKCGAAVCEYQYKGIGGTNVRDLTRAKNFPSKPDKIVQITTGTFSMTMKGNNLGVMMEGFVRAPITGEYTFSTRSDDSSEVWVAQKPMTQSGLTKVVELRGCCRKVQGRKKVSWKVGMPYYIRAYVKEGGGVEYGQVGMTVEGREWFPIPISAFVKL